MLQRYAGSLFRRGRWHELFQSTSAGMQGRRLGPTPLLLQRARTQVHHDPDLDTQLDQQFHDVGSFDFRPVSGLHLYFVCGIPTVHHFH